MSISFSWWWILACIGIACLGTWLLYFYNTSNLVKENKLRNYTLAAFRFLSLFILSFLLLQPIIKSTTRKVEKPLIVIAHDNSASLIKYSDSVFVKNEYLKKLNQLKKKLSEKYEVQFLSFGAQVKESDELTFNQQQSNISVVLHEIDIRYAQRNLGAVILASDGNYNLGENPNYTTSALQCPLYSIAVGDTNTKRDASIMQIIHNDISYLNNDFPVEVLLQAQKLLGNDARIIITQNGKVQASQLIKITSENLFTTVKLLVKASVKGIQKYTVSISKVGTESNLINNIQSFYIDVIDTKQKILIYAAAPHPDINAWSSALKSKDEFAVDVRYVSDVNINFSNYQVIVLHGLPNGDANSFASIKKYTLEQNIPGIFQWTASTNFQQWKQLQTGIDVANNKINFQEVNASINSNFSLFTIDNDIADQLKNWPPLQALYGNISITSDYSSLAYQTINGVQTNYPLILFSQNAAKKIGLITGEGIWLWRMANYKANESHTQFDNLLSKFIQLQSARKINELFKINVKKVLPDGEAIVFNAELYNSAIELINEPDVVLKLINSNNKSYNYTFNKDANTYKLVIPSLVPDDYTYEANTIYNGKAYKAKGKITITAQRIEDNVSKCNYDLLDKIAKKQGGATLLAKDILQLDELLIKKENIQSKSYLDKQINDLIHYPWIFVLLLALLSIEWFLRKRNGYN